MVQSGKFRSDLYFRLNIIQLETSPLRARGDDILLLSNYFLKKQCRRYRKKEMHFSKETEAVLLGYSWPGNVRELRNCIEQAVFFSKHTQIEASQINLSQKLGTALAPEVGDMLSSGQFVIPSEGISMEDVEQGFVVQALERANWNVTKAAQLLGLSRDTLRYRIEKYKLAPHS